MAEPMIPTHGRRSTYINYLCRCDLCKAANAAYYAKRSRERHAAMKRQQEAT